MSHTVKHAALALCAALFTAACGSSSAPTAPSSSTTSSVAAPTGFYQTSHKINATNNELTFAWDASATAGTTYLLVVGSTPGAADVASVDVTGTTYTWVSPRKAGAYYARLAAKQGGGTSAFTTELSLFVVDIRNMIDAMYFRGGPMSDTPDNAKTDPVTSVWADGSRLAILVSQEAGDTARTNGQTFAEQYADLIGGAVTASFSMTSETMRNVDYRSFAAFTIGVRVQSGYCGGALACVPVGSGPAPAGPNKSIVTLEAGGGLYQSATAHELGHAYGMGHVVTPAAGRPEFRFMMSPVNASEQMTAAEKLVITLARAAGLRAGWARSRALGADLVNPY